MAKLILTGYTGYFTWEITELGDTFTSDHYKKAGITKYSVEQGSESISGEVDWCSATSGTYSTGEGTVNYEPGTYTFYGYAQAANGKYYQAGSATVTVKGSTPSVAKWTWYGTNETSISDHTNPALDGEAYDAYWAITNKGPVSDFNHRVWNDMCFKCREILSALGYGHEGLNGWVNQYLSFDDTLMHTGNSVMTADRFNSLRYNIGVKFKVYWSFDPDTDIKKGKPVYGYYFTELTDAMNDWIDTL